MGVRIKNVQSVNGTDDQDMKTDAFGNVVEADGQAYYIGPGQRLNVQNEALGVSLASYSTNATDGTIEDAGVTGSTEGYTRF